MSIFKNKPNKIKYLSNVQTLDELHKSKLSKINNNIKLLPEQKKELIELKTKLSVLDKKKISSSDDIKIKAELITKINLYEANIKKMEANNDLLEYISKAEDILISYYDDNIEQKKEIVNLEKESKSEENITHGIFISEKLKILNEISQKFRKTKKPVKKRKLIQEQNNTKSKSKSILNFLSVNDNNDKKIISKQTINKATLQDQYLILTDKNYACDRVKSNRIILCTKCKIEKLLIQSDGCYVCIKCGETEPIVMENENSSHKDSMMEKQKYPYKKINHLKEKLNQFQAKESSKVPDEIFDVIKSDLKKQRINEKECTPLQIRKILKKHKMTNYYEHLHQIYCDITETAQITLQKSVEEKIINMFQEMQPVFYKYFPEERSNFLSYSYVLNKIFRILEMDHYADFFPLLQSKEKLRDQDIIWRKICKDMDWKFYPAK